MLSGKRTYLASAGLILVAIGGFLNAGDFSLTAILELLRGLFEGGALAFLRMGIGKK